MYHYTNEYAYRKILREKTLLKSSKDRDGTNHRYGDGVYLTSLQPETGRGKIKKNNLDGVANKPKYADKTQECYFKFDKRNLPGVKNVETKGSRDVWRFPNDINLSKISFYHGYTDESEYETYQQNNSSTTYAERYLPEGNNRTYETSTTEGWTSDLYDYEGRSLARTNRFSESASGSRYQPERSFGRSRGNDVYGSSQQQQEPETSGLGFIAGTAAVLAIGAAALGLFAASRPANRNN